MIYITEFLIILSNIWMAYHHSRLLKQNRKIQHGWWGFGYLTVVSLLAYLFGSWAFFVACLFIRKVFFDESLNLYNGRGIFFVSRETTSIIDKIHYKLFGNRSEIYQPIYLVVIGVLNILIAKGS